MIDTSHGDQLETLLTTGSAFEARAIAALLADAGIRNFVEDRALSGAGAETRIGGPGIPVKVPRRDVERACELLQASQDAAEGIDWDELDLGSRQDQLPLREPGRLPPLVRIAVLVAAALLVLLLVSALLLLAGL